MTSMVSKKMENPQTNTLTSFMILAISGFLKLLSHITPGSVITVLTILSLTLAIIYHFFGVVERIKTFRNANRKQ